MTKLPLVTAKAPLLAESVFEPTKLMLKSPNVATPRLSVDCAVVPLRLPAPFKLIATETLGTLLPKASCARTVTAGAMDTPAVALLGDCTKDN